MRNFKEALESNNVALELSPNSWNIWWDRGLILMGNESYEEAIKCIDKASNLCPQDPQNAEKWNNLGVYLAKIREGGNSLDLSHEAIKAYDKAIDLNPQLAEAWYSKSQVLEALGRTSEAEAAYAEAKDLGYAGCPPAFSRES
jgi:tetratricopeptide (TPR) repeat protein